MVDDGSTDGTAEVAEEIFAQRPEVMARVLRFAAESRQRPRRPRRFARGAGADRAFFTTPIFRRRSAELPEDRRANRGRRITTSFSARARWIAA